MQHLAAVQLVEHLQDAGDLAARRRLREALLRSLEMRAEIAVRGVFHRQAVEHLAVAEQRKRVEDANRARMAVEQIAEVRLAQPAVDAAADLDADDRRARDRDRPWRAARNTWPKPPWPSRRSMR